MSNQSYYTGLAGIFLVFTILELLQESTWRAPNAILAIVEASLAQTMGCLIFAFLCWLPKRWFEGYQPPPARRQFLFVGMVIFACCFMLVRVGKGAA